ncbi:MAG: hemerythrin domain-containing protein [Candidatus Micrarchaeota archaeon]
MDWLDVMNEEHAVVLKLVAALRAYSRKLGAPQAVPDGALDEILFLTTNFSDKCHHAKEETVLFPLLRKKSLKDSKIIDVLLAEHEQGRAFVRAIKAGDKVVENASGYCDLIPKHIAKENALFNEAQGLLSGEEKSGLFEGFEEIEERETGGGRHGEYAERVEEILKKVV